MWWPAGTYSRGSRRKFAIRAEGSASNGGERNGGGWVSGGEAEGVLGPGLMEQGEGVNAEVEERSKFGKSVVREIFPQRLGSRSVSGFGLPNKPQNLCKFVAILPGVTRLKA